MFLRWLNKLNRVSQRASHVALPNPFRPFSALLPETDQAMFRGRVDLAQRLILLPLFPEHKTAIVLSGPPRSGKTSFLNMLPSLLKEEFIFIDLTPRQRALLPEVYFQHLVEQARLRVKQQYGLSLPPLPVERNPYQAMRRWLENINHRCSEAHIVLLLDDFEHLGQTFIEGRIAFLRWLALLQEMIQQLDTVHLVLAGEHPVTELVDSAWIAHLPKIRPLFLERLPMDTAQSLLQQPVMAFSPEWLSDELAQYIVKHSGGHPFLVQLWGHLLVEHLNQAARSQVEWPDIALVQMQVLQQSHGFFRQLMQSQDLLIQDILLLAAQEKPIEQYLDAHHQRLLKRQWLLNEHTQLFIPLFGEWLKQHGQSAENV